MWLRWPVKTTMWASFYQKACYSAAMNFVVLEDHDLVRQALRVNLKDFGPVLALSEKSQLTGLKWPELADVDLFLIDLDLETPLAGLDALKYVSEHPAIKVVLTGRDDPEIIEQAYALGANDYLVKPFERGDLLDLVEQVKLRARPKLSQALRENLKSNGLGREDLAQFEVSLLSSLPISLEGETGTGKTTLAKIWHEHSPRSTGKFVALNCSAFSPELLESELFGHVKGAFTGADQSRSGKLELAHSGVLFLDEVHTMPKALQAKLLKAIEEKCFYPVGSEKEVSSDFQLISAGSENLEALVARGEFREDLYFRLQGVHIRLKPLRENAELLESLMTDFLNEGRRRRVFESKAWKTLLDYRWPGNRREIEKVFELLRAKKKNFIFFEDLPRKLRGCGALESYDPPGISTNWEVLEQVGLKNYLAQIERDLVGQALQQNRGKVRRTLDQLQISSHAFYRAMGNFKKDHRLGRVDQI
jgi:DNA-binding NtrC family response regulator